MIDCPTFAFNCLNVIGVWNRLKQGTHKWTRQSLHLTTCLFFLEFLFSLPYFHRCNAHNDSFVLGRGVCWRLYLPPKTNRWQRLPFSGSKAVSFTLWHLIRVEVLFLSIGMEVGVILSGVNVRPRKVECFFRLASKKFWLFGPYFSGLIHPSATHFWNS